LNDTVINSAAVYLRRNRTAPWVVGALLLLAQGCAKGIEPPDLTPLIKIDSGRYVLGPPGLACSGASKLDLCDAKTPAKLLTWAPRVQVQLAEFEIESREVSNLQYRWCVDAGACTEPASPVSWKRYSDPAYDHYPVVYVSQSQAADYCRFVGRRLPSEAEWEVAARKGLDSDRLYAFPYGDSPVPSCSKGKGHFLACGAGKAPLKPDYSEYDRTPNKVRNMASNVAEWVRDQWRVFGDCAEATGDNIFCVGVGAAPAGANCVKSCDGKQVACRHWAYYTPSPGTNPSEGVVRGGHYGHSDPCEMRLYIRRKQSSAYGDRTIGFRCADAQTIRPLDYGFELGTDQGQTAVDAEPEAGSVTDLGAGDSAQ